MSARERAKELLGHYLSHDGEWGDRVEAEDCVDHIVDAAIEAVDARTNRVIKAAGGLAASLTLRDYFAAKSMPIIHEMANGELSPEEIAHDCYGMADAMLKARGPT